MTILEEDVWVEIGGNNLRYYESLGYDIPKRRRNNKVSKDNLTVPRGTRILVKVKDLPRNSSTKITKICDICGNHIPNQEYGAVMSRRIERDGKDRCYKCGKINGGITRKNNTPYEKSLEFWARENNMEYLLEEFSDRNNSNTKGYSHGSVEAVLWNCPKCKSEYDMSIVMRTNSKSNCPYCAGQRVNNTNCLWTTHPEIAKLLANPEEGYIVSKGRTKKVDFSCPECGFKEPKIIQDIIRQRYSCSMCSDGYSYPEKYMLNVLNQLNLKVQRQKSFKWSKNIKSENKRLSGTKKYDFYLQEFNCIIEVHGEQHYTSKFAQSETSLQDEKDNDVLKEKLANDNEIEYYIVINCAISDPDYIKENIESSKLKELFNLEDINWNECHNYSISSLVKSICDLWGNYTSVKEISEKVDIDITTIRRYLTQGSKIGLCDYNGQNEATKTRKKNLLKINKIRSVKVIQLTEEGKFIKEWDSVAQAQKYYNINNISAVCRLRQETAGGYRWMYKDNYEEIIKEQGKVEFKTKPRVIQISLEGDYIAEHENIGKACVAVGRNSKFHSTIKICCEKNHRTAYGFKWMYKEDYDKLKAESIENEKEEVFV